MTPSITLLAVTLGALFASMPPYALWRHGKGSIRGGKGDWRSVLLGRFIQQWFYWVLRPVERAALALGLAPLALNLAGVALGVIAGVLFALGRSGPAGWAILLGGICDILDGQVARALGVAGPRGAFLDSTLDRFAESAVFVGLTFFYLGDGTAQLLVIASLGGSLLVSYVRAAGESAGVRCSGGLMQRAERLLALGLGGIFDPAVSFHLARPSGLLLEGVLVLVSVGTFGTAIYRVMWITRRLER